MDVLTDVLETVRARAAWSGRIEASAPWDLSLESGQGARVHAVLEGRAYLIREGAEPIELVAGDLVALPHGDRHVLTDALADPAVAVWNGDGLNVGARATACAPVRIGGSGEQTTLLSGRIEYDDGHGNAVFALLPRLIVLRGELVRSVPWLEPTLRTLACEAASGRPGALTVVNRLAEVVLVQIVRGHLASADAETGGFLGALGDRQIGAALSLIHQSPGLSWTVQELAARVAMSRSAFAARFTKLVGEPPLHYVARWRMQKARSLLREGRATIGEVAEAVGYESEAAFSKAFKRAVGTAPGAYRRAKRASGFPEAA
jgi:AraC-like DNA-binding protein